METISLTYDNIAERFGISGSSARNLVRRKRWKRITGNDGKARVEVPLEALPEAPRVVPSDPPSVVPSVDVAMARLEVEVAGLKALVDSEKRRGDEAVERLKTVEADRDQWMRQAVRPWWRRLSA